LESAFERQTYLSVVCTGLSSENVIRKAITAVADKIPCVINRVALCSFLLTYSLALFLSLSLPPSRGCTHIFSKSRRGGTIYFRFGTRSMKCPFCDKDLEEAMAYRKHVAIRPVRIRVVADSVEHLQKYLALLPPM
jgi:hypothetical protein